MQPVKTLNFKLVTTNETINLVALSTNRYGAIDQKSRVPKGLHSHCYVPGLSTRSAYLESLGRSSEAEKIKKNRCYLQFIPEVIESLSGISDVSNKLKVATLYFDPNKCTEKEFILGINWLIEALQDNRIARNLGNPILFEVRKGFELIKINDKIELVNDGVE